MTIPTRYPQATWFPLGGDPEHQPLLNQDAIDIICIHTMVGSLPGTDEYFKHVNGEGWVGTESHFGTGPYGEIHQYTDLSRTADANLDGNDHIVSIENADTGAPYPSWSESNVPEFTNQQMDALVQLVAWLCDKYGIPAVATPNSKRGNTGISWHRQGVPSVPPFQAGYMVPGGEKWTDTPGKVCPGDKRIAQIKTIIIPQVAEMLKGGKIENPWPSPGDHSVVVLNCKKRLSNAGFDVLTMDNFYGPSFRKTVTTFQLSRDDLKADADGLFGPKTWAAVQALPMPEGPHGSFQNDEAVQGAELTLHKGIQDLIDRKHPTWAGVLLKANNDIKNFGK